MPFGLFSLLLFPFWCFSFIHWFRLFLLFLLFLVFLLFYFYHFSFRVFSFSVSNYVGVSFTFHSRYAKEREERKEEKTPFFIRFLSLPFVSHFYTLYPHLFVNSFLSFLLHFLSVISFVSHFSHDFPISFYHRSSTMSSLSSPFAIFSSHFFDSLIPLLSFAFFSLIPFIPLFSYSFPRVFLFHSFHYFPLLSHAAAQRRPNARQRK